MSTKNFAGSAPDPLAPPGGDAPQSHSLFLRCASACGLFPTRTLHTSPVSATQSTTFILSLLGPKNPPGQTPPAALELHLERIPAPQNRNSLKNPKWCCSFKEKKKKNSLPCFSQIIEHGKFENCPYRLLEIYSKETTQSTEKPCAQRCSEQPYLY